jgi:hypothetical protein
MECWIEHIETLDLLGKDVEEEPRSTERVACSLPQDADVPRLSRWLKDCPIRRVRSRVLGVDVLFAADDAEIPLDNTLPVYFAYELRRMVGKTPRLVRAIHAVKVAFDGEVLQ